MSREIFFWQRVSKVHYSDPKRPGHTLCGLTVPDDAEVIDTDGDYMESPHGCRLCRRADRARVPA